MATVIETIRLRLSDAEARIERLRAEMARAEADKSDLQTALRVLGDVGLEETDLPTKKSPERSRPASEKKSLMFEVLGVGRAAGKQPKAVHDALLQRGIDDITIGTVRTTLWRAADAGELESADGYYWKHEAEDPLFSEPSAHISSAGMTSGGASPSDHASDRAASHYALFEPERGGGT